MNNKRTGIQSEVKTAESWDFANFVYNGAVSVRESLPVLTDTASCYLCQYADTSYLDLYKMVKCKRRKMKLVEKVCNLFKLIGG